MIRTQTVLLILLSCLGLAQFSRSGGGGGRGGFPPDQTNRPNAADETPVFRAITRLVQVDVVVRGKDAPVEGLTKADFELKDNGKLQNIAVFAVRKADATPPQMPALPPGVVTNRPTQGGSEPVVTTILLLDRLSTRPVLQETARAQAIKFLQHSNRHDPIAIYSLNSDVKILQPVTTDHDALLRALQNSKTENPFIPIDTPGAGQRIAEVTTAAFQSLMRQLKGLPGRKKLIWMSTGLPLPVRQDDSFNEPKNESTKMLTVAGAERLLNDANTGFYPVSVLGVLPFVVSGGGTPGDVALASGGRAFYGDNALDIGLQEALSDTDTIYTLGFYQPSDAVDGQYHSISVNVLRKSPAAQTVKDVRYRKGYDAEQRKPPLTEKQRTGTLDAVVQEPLDETAIGIQAAAVPSKTHPGYYDVEVAVNVADLQLDQKAGRRVGSFDVSVVPDVPNHPKGLHQVIAVKLKEENYADALATGITVVNRVKVVDDKGKPLSKTLHFVVLDGATGKAGSLRIPINPPPTKPSAAK